MAPSGMCRGRMSKGAPGLEFPRMLRNEVTAAWGLHGEIRCPDYGWFILQGFEGTRVEGTGEVGATPH